MEQYYDDRYFPVEKKPKYSQRQVRFEVWNEELKNIYRFLFNYQSCIDTAIIFNDQDFREQYDKHTRWGEYFWKNSADMSCCKDDEQYCNRKHLKKYLKLKYRFSCHEKCYDILRKLVKCHFLNRVSTNRVKVSDINELTMYQINLKPYLSELRDKVYSL